MDMTPFVEIILALAGIFATCAVVSTIVHHQDSSAIKSQTALAIQSLVAITTVGITGSLAEETVELHAIPTPNVSKLSV